MGLANDIVDLLRLLQRAPASEATGAAAGAGTGAGADGGANDRWAVAIGRAFVTSVEALQAIVATQDEERKAAEPDDGGAELGGASAGGGVAGGGAGGSAGAGGSGKWSCVVCEQANERSDTHCSVCRTVNPHPPGSSGAGDQASAAAPAPAPAAAAETESWMCAACTFANDGGRDTCDICGTARPADGGGENTMWPCPVCTLLNAAAMHECGICGSKKPDNVTTAADASASAPAPASDGSAAASSSTATTAPAAPHPASVDDAALLHHRSAVISAVDSGTEVRRAFAAVSAVLWALGGGTPALQPGATVQRADHGSGEAGDAVTGVSSAGIGGADATGFLSNAALSRALLGSNQLGVVLRITGSR